MPRCGIVALAGQPNAGKSTLLNALVGEPIAIVSAKPQTTREPVRGLLTEAETQILFVDPAGLLEPTYPLQRAMVRAALAELRGADLILHLHPLSDAPAPPLGALLRSLHAEPAAGPGVDGRTLTVYTKADLAPGAARPDIGTPDGAPSAVVVSARTGTGLHQLLDAVRGRLPEGPFLFDAEDVGTQPLRFFAAEFVREAVFAALEEELPYSVAVEIEEFREAEEPVYIRATLAVERDSQKPIVLGKAGRTIRAIGTAARERLATFLGRRVYLDLWVTVWPRWRRDPAVLARLGLPLPPENAR
jgi:GTP-binding protein Era